ncbi:hypothetical protein GDO81_026300 [Engystomops pustulosus]|uniref:Taste receptor type 2 n=1 Tax=Engystomops pustulosus TaxID=76066 RepID=A0AAV6YND3_ENGPU|nr:hypothetical protein GDO81_026300 [Engystomops pustulosus]
MESGQWIQELCLFITASIACAIGLQTNLFIVGVSVIDRLKRRPLTPADLLITAIATSRILFQFMTLLDLFWITFNGVGSATFAIPSAMIVSSSAYSNIWLSVLQSVFYSLKISNFHNILFLCLKKIILQRVLGLAIMFVVMSICYALADILTFVMTSPNNSTQDGGTNHMVQFIRYRVFLLWNVLPFLFYVVSCSALLGSLCRHMYRMRREDNVTVHLDTYYKTIKFTVASFCCFALYVSFNMFGNFLLSFPALLLVGNCFLMLHSLYLIYMTPQLRAQVIKILNVMTRAATRNFGVHD